MHKLVKSNVEVVKSENGETERAIYISSTLPVPQLSLNPLDVKLFRLTRFLGCPTAYAVFVWRYMNVPMNWEYVGSIWSIAVMILTLIPEVIYPVVYIRIRIQKEKIA